MIENFLEAIRTATGGAPSEVTPGKLTRFPTSDRRGQNRSKSPIGDSMRLHEVLPDDKYTLPNDNR